jgi:antitoxin component YwqK of YwqJK toxin-antitoxin module
MKISLSAKKIIVLFLALQFIFFKADAQNKSFKISVKGDTINAIDYKGLKQGKWVIHVDPLRGEPGYEEEGIFVNNLKEGNWRKYSLQGDLVALENYKKGDKDGLSRYFTSLGDLVREENWRAYNPDEPYDTIPIYGTGNNEIISYKIVKAEPYSVKDGDWTYYDPTSGTIIKSEKYDRGHLVTPQVTDVVKDEPMKKIVPKEVLEYQKKNSHKKHIKVRDGATGN